MNNQKMTTNTYMLYKGKCVQVEPCTPKEFEVSQRDARRILGLEEVRNSLYLKWDESRYLDPSEADPNILEYANYINSLSWPNVVLAFDGSWIIVDTRDVSEIN